MWVFICSLCSFPQSPILIAAKIMVFMYYLSPTFKSCTFISLHLHTTSYNTILLNTFWHIFILKYRCWRLYYKCKTNKCNLSQSPIVLVISEYYIMVTWTLLNPLNYSQYTFLPHFVIRLTIRFYSSYQVFMHPLKLFNWCLL